MPRLNSSTRDRVGYVYVLSNPSMPGVVKIGMARNGAAVRARALNCTSVPAPFVVEFEVLCLDAERAEERAHRYAGKNRVTASREFFEISVRDAVGHVIDAAWADWESYDPAATEWQRQGSCRNDACSPASRETALAHIASLKAMFSQDGHG
jgi:hypothetical protein